MKNRLRTKTEPRRLIRRLLMLLPLAALGFLWPTIAKRFPAWIEAVYARRIYPAVNRALASVTSAVPFSVAEILLCAVILGALIGIVGGAVRLIARRIRFSRFLSMLLSLALFAAVLLNLFYATWGLNYFRAPLAQRMGLNVGSYSEKELTRLVECLVSDANALRPTLSEDENGVFRYTDGLQPMLDALPDTYRALKLYSDAFTGHPTRAKRVTLSVGLSRLGIAGIYIGMTGEPNVNVNQPDLLIAEGAAHEIAHGLGIASENEAQFAAYLACSVSDDPAVRYSGTVDALISAGNALYRVNPERYAAIRRTYCDGLIRDLDNYNAYWRRYEGKPAEIATKTNDSYLKFNGQSSGVRSYGESVDLMLCYFKSIGRLTDRAAGTGI